MEYQIQASNQTPALIIYVLDVSASMSTPLGEKRRIDVIKDNLQMAFKQMIFRSTKGKLVSPRYRIALIAYSDTVWDLLDGIKGIDHIARLGIPDLALQRFTNTSKAFEIVEQILETELPKMDDCPAPVVCHMTDGMYTGKDPSPIAERIKKLYVKDGNVLFENIYISNDAENVPVTDVRHWEGIMSNTQFSDEYAAKLRDMSSPLPESYRELLVEYGYHLKSGSLMMLPGTSPDLVSLGLQMSAATPTVSSSNRVVR